MARKPSIPSYRLHRQSGQAVVTLTSPSGRRRDYLLGEYKSPESYAEYTRLLAEWQENHQRIPDRSNTDITVNELLLAFWEHVELTYRYPDGRPTSEVDNFRASLKPLRKLYGSSLVRDFGPLALKAVRRSMIDSGLARPTINGRISRIRLAFRWGVSEELVPANVLHAIEAVDGLRAGRTEAREPERIKPVDDATIQATLPYLSPTVAAMVQVQRLTGMRPGEVCKLKLADVDRTGNVWLYRPSQHKNAWRGKDRVIGIGPRAQAILQPFLTDDLQAYLFDPRDTVSAKMAARSANRQTPRYPSHMRRNDSKRKKAPERAPKGMYATTSYCRAVVRACDVAFPPPVELARKNGESVASWKDRLKPEQRQELAKWRAKHRWHPNQLRHSFATQVRRQFGLDGAQVALGHSEADTTQIYAETDAAHIAIIAAQIG